MYKKIYTLIFIFVLITTNTFSSEDKFVFIDINFIFNNSVAGKKMNKKFQEKTLKINGDLKDFQKKIENERKTLLTQKNVISEEEFKKKVSYLDKQIKEFNISINKKNNDLQKLKNETRLKFSSELKKILTDFSKENSISMIINKENILIGKTSLDVTKNILDRFDKGVKKLN